MSVQRITHFTSWDDEKEHRQKVIAKLEKVAGLEALLAEWESCFAKATQDSDDYRAYIRELKERLRSARCQYDNMKP